MWDLVSTFLRAALGDEPSNLYGSKSGYAYSGKALPGYRGVLEFLKQQPEILPEMLEMLLKKGRFMHDKEYWSMRPAKYAPKSQ